MKLYKARLEGMDLVLECDDFPARQEAARFISEFKPGDYEIRKRRKKRSLDANAYCWVLIDQIAALTGINKAEIYRSALREIGGVSDVVCVSKKAADRLKYCWERQGLGWQCILDRSRFENCANATLIYGSSVFNTKQMSSLIDSLVQDARSLGIETLTDEKRSLLVEEWKRE